MAHDESSTDADEPEQGAVAGPARYDWSRDGTPSEAVVEAVAAATGRDPTDLPTLHGHVDADALDALLDGGTADAVCVTFAYDGMTVVADSDGWIEVGPSADE